MLVFGERYGVGYDDFRDVRHICEVDGGFAGEDAVGGGYEDIACTVEPQPLCGGGHGSAGGDFVVDQDCVSSVDLTDDVVGLDAVVVSGSTFLDDGEGGVHEVGEVACAFRAADVGRYYDGGFEFFLDEVFREHGHGGQLVDGDFEEALYLPCV